MKNKAQPHLGDPKIQPTQSVIASILKDSFICYERFLTQVESKDLGILWRYYPDGKSWLAKGIYSRTGKRGALKEITVFWLSIWEGMFKVTIYLPEKVREQALSLPLNDQTRQMLTEARRMGETLKFLPLVFELKTDEQFESLFRVIDFKKNLK